MPENPVLRVRQRLGKYRIEARLAEGGFAAVYKAFDTIEGIHVALKVPHPHYVSRSVLDDFRREVRLAAKLDHPYILPIKNAEIIDQHFLVASPLGEGTLGDRLSRRMAPETALGFANQMLQALAYAHQRSIIHCDVKPENFILFPENRLRLSDFGIAKVAFRTVRASGSGTVGYIAPEQAMGKPSFRSDVFSTGLILYRMFAGHLPEWPFEWPPPGYDRLRRRVGDDFIRFLQRSIDVDPRRRYSDAQQMLTAFCRVRKRALHPTSRPAGRAAGGSRHRDWKTVRRRQFQQRWGHVLQTIYDCPRCNGPVSEAMHACSWCGSDRSVFRDATRFPACCPRCARGLKLDWRYCPWCYGPGFEVQTTRQFSDIRYTARCENSSCDRKLLMPFMRYCPWCHRKVRRKWKIAGSPDRCSGCGWGVIRGFWDYCPWCARRLEAK